MREALDDTLSSMLFQEADAPEALGKCRRRVTGGKPKQLVKRNNLKLKPREQICQYPIYNKIIFC